MSNVEKEGERELNVMVKEDFDTTDSNARYMGKCTVSYVDHQKTGRPMARWQSHESMTEMLLDELAPEPQPLQLACAPFT